MSLIGLGNWVSLGYDSRRWKSWTGRMSYKLFGVSSAGHRAITGSLTSRKNMIRSSGFVIVCFPRLCPLRLCFIPSVVHHVRSFAHIAPCRMFPSFYSPFLGIASFSPLCDLSVFVSELTSSHLRMSSLSSPFRSRFKFLIPLARSCCLFIILICHLRIASCALPHAGRTTFVFLCPPRSLKAK